MDRLILSKGVKKFSFPRYHPYSQFMLKYARTASRRNNRHLITSDKSWSYRLALPTKKRSKGHSGGMSWY